jgi:hypothetical protein
MVCGDKREGKCDHRTQEEYLGSEEFLRKVAGLPCRTRGTGAERVSMQSPTSRNCSHLNSRDHVVRTLKGGRRVWTCTKCGTEDVWRDGWQMFGFIHGECPKCWEDVVDFVLCPKCVFSRLVKVTRPKRGLARHTDTEEP